VVFIFLKMEKDLKELLKMVNKVKENITIQIQMYIKDSGLMI
jgi:hypothetical protein